MTAGTTLAVFGAVASEGRPAVAAGGAEVLGVRDGAAHLPLATYQRLTGAMIGAIDRTGAGRPRGTGLPTGPAAPAGPAVPAARSNTDEDRKGSEGGAHR
jgi:hypothetical protein